jgi:hypothetical protein
MHADGIARDRIIPERSATALRGWEQAELLGVFYRLAAPLSDLAEREVGGQQREQA